MDFSKLRESVNKDEPTIKLSTVDHLYIGINPYLAKHILNNNSESKMLLVSNPIDEHDVRFKGPSTYRFDVEPTDLDTVEDERSVYESIFYKDGKFRPFGGRTTPQRFFEGERFYSQKAYALNEEIFFADSCAGVIEKLTALTFEKIVMDIEFGKEEVIVRLADNEQITAKKLYWGYSIPELVEVTRNKDVFEAALLDQLDVLAGPSKLIIEMDINVNKFETGKTYFIPFSAGQELGHFIGEFIENGKKVTGKFLFHLNNEEPSEQYLTSVIKKLKATLRRIFELSERDFLGDYIFFGRSPAPIDGGVEDLEALKINIQELSLISEYHLGKSEDGFYGHECGLTSLNY